MNQDQQQPTCQLHNMKIEFIRIADYQNESNIFYCFKCLREKQCAKNTFIHISTLQNKQANLTQFFFNQNEQMYSIDKQFMNIDKTLTQLDFYLNQIQEYAKKLKNSIIEKHNSIIDSIYKYNQQLSKMNMIFTSQQFKDQIKLIINKLQQDTFLERTAELKIFLEQTINEYKHQEYELKQLYENKASNTYKIYQITTQMNNIESFLFQLHKRNSFIENEFLDKVVYRKFIDYQKYMETTLSHDIHILIIKIIKIEGFTIYFYDKLGGYQQIDFYKKSNCKGLRIGFNKSFYNNYNQFQIQDSIEIPENTIIKYFIEFKNQTRKITQVILSNSQTYINQFQSVQQGSCSIRIDYQNIQSFELQFI